MVDRIQWYTVSYLPYSYNKLLIFWISFDLYFFKFLIYVPKYWRQRTYSLILYLTYLAFFTTTYAENTCFFNSVLCAFMICCQKGLTYLLFLCSKAFLTVWVWNAECFFLFHPPFFFISNTQPQIFHEKHQLIYNLFYLPFLTSILFFQLKERTFTIAFFSVAEQWYFYLSITTSSISVCLVLAGAKGR